MIDLAILLLFIIGLVYVLYVEYRLDKIERSVIHREK